MNAKKTLGTHNRTMELLNKPVKPKKSLSLFSGLILGLLISGIISIIIEKNKDLIYETDEFERFFDPNLILDLAKCSNKNYLENIYLISNWSKSNIESSSVFILKIGRN